MIRLTRLNHVPIFLNCDLIEHIETTPDTVITLTSREKIRVLETAEEIVNRVIEFRSSIQARARDLAFGNPGGPVLGDPGESAG